MIGPKEPHREFGQADKKVVPLELTPLKAIRRFCIDCMAGMKDVPECGGDEQLSGWLCAFYPYRMGKGRPSVKIIRKFCIECMGGDLNRRQNTIASRLVDACTSKDCHLWEYRIGRNLNVSGKRINNLKKHKTSDRVNAKKALKQVA